VLSAPPAFVLSQDQTLHYSDQLDFSSIDETLSFVSSELFTLTLLPHARPRDVMPRTP
jgi:hypothetical protein